MVEKERKVAAWAGWLLLAALWAVAMPAMAAGPGAVRKQIESSLLLKGDVDIEPDGSVSQVMLDREEKLPEGVVKLVHYSASRWKFEPVVVDGRAVRARAPMSVRVVARKLDGQYRVEIHSASFQRYDATRRDTVTPIKMAPPRYPENAFRVGAGGTVYLILKIGRDGTVQDAVAEQVNLRIVASEGDMRKLRGILAQNALGAAQKWTFNPPTEGDEVDDPYWTVRVPINYSFANQLSEEDYGTWVSYVPGPRERAPWVIEEDRAGFSPDALAEGGVYMANQEGPRLLTPLQGG
ncbi:energy transducer TonB [Pseudomonas sp. Hp2]|jgi:TonB family protein|uniref:energy transducer TonB n=1 Tax=Pseudomonas sp. Hp2 TaxID=701189 RepID=UPI001127600D|nr:energy transducer TonB [Pseudomonas sp. Hp2]